MTPPSAYTSVSGARHPDDVRMLDHLALGGGGVSDPCGTPTHRAWRRRSVCGVLVSAKTLSGQAGGSARYPAIDVVERMLRTDGPPVWLHFNSRDPAPLDEQLLRMLGRLPAQGVQINVPCADPSAVRRFRDAMPDVEVVLQASGDSVPSLEPSAFGEYVMRFEGAIDHALIDLSRGTGKAIDPAWASACLLANAARWLDAGIRPGLAGGLGPDAGAELHAVKRAVGRDLFLECSFDAETKVCGADGLDEGRVEGYWRALSLAFQGV